MKDHWRPRSLAENKAVAPLAKKTRNEVFKEYLSDNPPGFSTEINGETWGDLAFTYQSLKHMGTWGRFVPFFFRHKRKVKRLSFLLDGARVPLYNLQSARWVFICHAQ